jgi:hypothetical protein
MGFLGFETVMAFRGNAQNLADTDQKDRGDVSDAAIPCQDARNQADDSERRSSVSTEALRYELPSAIFATMVPQLI